ncbi:PA14 domain-containing protein [Bdellovibrio sp. BCCA]|uniref:PA14 domain-containing protein n=1 Tax=Bdellovibrio sp. BCCA TaxID=3136281 RepID=UPI0030F3371E
MGKSLFIAALLFSLSVQAKNQQDDIRYRKGMLKKISCSFSGISRTNTGSSIGSIDFPADPANTVCDPLSNNSSSSPEMGLLGKLILRTPEMGAKVNSVLDYYNKGQKLDQNLYFADVNVPTRPFTEGFSAQNGDVLTDSQGNKLIENFAIEYTSVLKLTDADKEGDYEIATLSDDGSRVFIKEGDKWNELINNDGNHSTRMGCPYRTINLKKDSEVPLKILYYQGPRYHIANVLIWKLHKKAHSWKEPSHHSLCGISTNNFFFNSSNGKRMPAMTILEKSGWNVVAPGNFKMPERQQNPCVEEKLAISDFQVTSAVAPNATITWKTTVPASSQLHIVNIYTGEEIFTQVDNNLLTDHTVEISGLVHGIYYQVRAISKDAKGNEAMTAFINLLP